MPFEQFLEKKNSQFFFNKVDNGIYIYIPFSLPFQFFFLVLKVFCVGSYYILIYIEKIHLGRGQRIHYGDLIDSLYVFFRYR